MVSLFIKVSRFAIGPVACCDYKRPSQCEEQETHDDGLEKIGLAQQAAGSDA